MSALEGAASACCHDLGPETIDDIRALIVRSTPESLEQAVLQLTGIRQRLAMEVSGKGGLKLNAVEMTELRDRLTRLRECAERGDQMVSGRLQLVLGPNLLYDRKARPSEAYLPSRMQVRG